MSTIDCTPFLVPTVSANECIGDSLTKINSNFAKLQDLICNTQVQIGRKLHVENHNILWDDFDHGTQTYGDTYQVNFSGTGIHAFVDPENQTGRKTIYIPLTGVYSLSAADSIIDNTVTYPMVEVLSSSLVRYDENDIPLHEGIVTLRLRVPNPIRQIRTFYFSGPQTATNVTDRSPIESMDDGNNTKPSKDTIETFVNGLGLNTPNVSRENDQVWVIYQKTGYKNVIKPTRSIPRHKHSYSVNVPISNHSHLLKTQTDQQGRHNHKTEDSGTGGSHNHPAYSIICWGCSFRVKDGGSHSHAAVTVTTEGLHAHSSYADYKTSNNTNITTTTPKPLDIVVKGDTSTKASDTVGAITVEAYRLNTVLYKLNYTTVSGVQKYRVASGYPRYVSSIGADSDDWIHPENWKSFDETFTYDPNNPWI